MTTKDNARAEIVDIAERIKKVSDMKLPVAAQLMLGEIYADVLALHPATPPASAGELESYEKFDGVGPHSETIETRARIGERYLECYESALSDPRLKGYTPADCPSELLLDMLCTWEPIDLSASSRHEGVDGEVRAALEEARNFARAVSRYPAGPTKQIAGALALRLTELLEATSAPERPEPVEGVERAQAIWRDQYLHVAAALRAIVNFRPVNCDPQIPDDPYIKIARFAVSKARAALSYRAADKYPRAALTLPANAGADGVEDEEIYQIGKRDGYEQAVQDIDMMTGGDGEYFASTIPGHGCPDPETMKRNIADRFAALSPAAGREGEI